MGALYIVNLSSLAFYIYYKIQQYRTSSSIEKKWISSKSSIAFGVFVGFIGVNQLVLHLSIIGVMVGIIFSIIGFAGSFLAYREYRFYLPFVNEEKDITV
ncbi:YtpI family protein [Domibacillus robiginosus]|uniref:YtpI family protein n=1 Tax=Domibacillus robiginosus TaxID=1071054 RepID=UPI00067D0E1A|nr:YtpI family protein [Domibacillus robiginosus]